jgi:hypothetical protein
VTLELQPPESDLIGTERGGGPWEPHTIHTHYFGFHIPEARIGGFTYLRYHPYFPLSQGSVCIFDGLRNFAPLDIAYLDWQMTMPWPRVDGATITAANGYRIEFTELGSTARVSYANGDTSFELEQTAITPLLARGAAIPGENLDVTAAAPSGSEQFMHCTGELTLRGRRYDVDCYAPRDRSWFQSRTEQRGGRHDPPIAWTPMYFPGTGLAFNQVGFEAPDSKPAWDGLLTIPPGMATHHFAWVFRDGRLSEITDVRRTVTSQHPQLHFPLEQVIEATDAEGNDYHFRGTAIAAAPIPSWPNASTFDSVVRWEDAHGNAAHGPCQGIWYDAYQHAMKRVIVS